MAKKRTKAYISIKIVYVCLTLLNKKGEIQYFRQFQYIRMLVI